ncbi:MAG: thiamine ABC transporter substrate-binding protein [Candidatus Cloacimonetes bacterium]|nr:thiamine ABC transporter substrate-binding protein [Candidatus Cloacimonadota bacterium]
MKYLSIIIISIMSLSCWQTKEREIPETVQTLNVYTVDVFLNESFYHDILPVFSDIFNCNIELTRFSSSFQMLDHVRAESDSCKADILIGLDNTQYYSFYSDSLFASYEPTGINNLHSNLIFDKHNVITPICYSNIGFNYNSNALGDPPLSFGEMQDGKYKEQIIIMDPRTSGLGRALLHWSISAFGISGYGHFWRSIKENILKCYENQDDAYNAFLAGEAPIILGFETTSLYHNDIEKSNKYRNTIPQEGTFKYIIGVSILKSTEQEYLAKKLVDYLISPQFQEKIISGMWMLPANKKIKLPPEYEILPKAGKDLTNDLSVRQIRFQQNTWISKWQKIMIP